MEKVGKVSEEIISLFGLSALPDTPICIGKSNIVHMQQSHPNDYRKYGGYIKEILKSPDLVGINAKDNSIEYVKEFESDGEFVKVAVRVSTNGVYFARSIYALNQDRVWNFIAKGTLKRLTPLK